MKKKGKTEHESHCKETFEPLQVEGKTVATVVLLLRSPEEDILAKACEAIHIFAEKGDENKVSLLGLGALEPLCQLINHSNDLIRRNAFIAVGLMAMQSDVKNAMKKISVIPSIIEKLSIDEEDVAVHEYGTLCLSYLSVDFVCKVQILDNKGLPAMIHLLSSTDPDVKKNSLEVIYNLVQDHHGRMAVHTLGGIPAVLELMNSEFPVIQHLALRTLHNITTHKDTHGTFREDEGFEKIMDILKNKDFTDLHAEALQVVTNCVSCRENLELFQRLGGLTWLIEIVLTQTLPEIQSNALKCIARVAQSSENRKLLHEQNIEKVLVDLLLVEDERLKTATCQVIASMSVLLSSKSIYRDIGGFVAIVRLLRSKISALREAATQALLTLTANNKLNTFAVYRAGGHELLVRQLSDSCPNIVANAAAVLGNMGEHEVIRSKIHFHGAMSALVGPLKSTDSQVQINTTLCIADLACDVNARVELQKAGGLSPLVNLLHSYHKEVLRNTCLAISVCAVDEAMAVEMCKFGALELLQQINKSANRRSKFSEAAMIGLLNSHLSLKYSLTGCLAATDVITDGFYDAGKSCAGQSVLTLEELSKQPLNQQRPIIVFSSGTEKTEEPPEEKNINQPDIETKGERKTLRKKKDDDKQKDEVQPESLMEKEKRNKLIEDIPLQVLIKEAKDSILPLKDEEEQYAALARLVSEAMGGAVQKEHLHEFSWELHISEVKFQLQSNVVPLGMINKGIYYHRALLFKCLADCIGMSCTLVRGEYNRAWNEVILFKGNPSRGGHSSQPSRFIVDLMHEPGSLLPVNTLAALQYQTI